MAVTTIDTLRTISVDFAKTYDWEVGFDSFPGFFPAHILNDTAFSFQSGHMEYGAWPFLFPELSIRGKAISIEIFEVSDYRVAYWVSKWQGKIQGKNFSIRLLGMPGVTEVLTVQRLTAQRVPSIVERFIVIPEGDVQVNQTSDKGGTPLSYTLNMSVVGNEAQLGG